MIAGSRVAGASLFKDDVLAEPSACVLTAYPLGLLYDPNMTWKTEPAPQPTENLIQEQACALFKLSREGKVYLKELEAATKYESKMTENDFIRLKRRASF